MTVLPLLLLLLYSLLSLLKLANTDKLLLIFYLSYLLIQLTKLSLLPLNFKIQSIILLSCFIHLLLSLLKPFYLNFSSPSDLLLILLLLRIYYIVKVSHLHSLNQMELAVPRSNDKSVMIQVGVFPMINNMNGYIWEGLFYILTGPSTIVIIIPFLGI